MCCPLPVSHLHLLVRRRRNLLWNMLKELPCSLQPMLLYDTCLLGRMEMNWQGNMLFGALTRVVLLKHLDPLTATLKLTLVSLPCRTCSPPKAPLSAATVFLPCPLLKATLGPLLRPALRT